jgi:SAM-dependent methyltransferase
MLRALRNYWRSRTHSGEKRPDSDSDPEYLRRLEQELANYSDDLDVHALPEIFHYWSNKYIRPWFEGLDTTHPEDLFVNYLLESAEASEKSSPRFVSIGAGNCDAEIAIAEELINRGLSHFSLECLDINPSMLARGQDLARDKGLLEHLAFVRADFNAWHPDGQYDAILANQCLHHVQNLEGLFSAIDGALAPKGLFITSDMIGRNGHQRWPEAEAIVAEIWGELDDRYKYNHQLARLEKDFVNHDCSTHSFEGIRAQDILPLLIEHFSFHVFIAFGNVIDLFIDRGFGHNYDASKEEDRAFIDRLHEIDEAGFKDGTLKPTHMVAVMGRRDNPPEQPYFARGLGPEQALRSPA